MAEDDKPSQTPPDTGDSSHLKIHAAVIELQRLIRSRYAVRGVAWAIGALLAATLLGAVCFAYVPASGWLRGLFALTVLGAIGAAIYRAAIRPWRPFADAHNVARHIEAKLPVFRDDISASLQFGRDLPDLRADGRVSVPMIERVLTSTRARLEEHAAALPETAPRVDLRAPLGVAAAAIACLLVLGVLAPNLVTRGLSGLVFGPPDAVASAVNGRKTLPIVADIALDLSFPAHTHIGHRAQLNSSGELEVVRGTKVGFEAVALRPIKRAELVFDLEPPELPEGATAPDASSEASPTGPGGRLIKRVLLERRPGERVVAAFEAVTSGTYTIEAELEDGSLVTDGIERQLVVHADEAPRVSLIQPEGELDVAPDDMITFEYSATDDYGLTEIAIITTFEGDEASRRRTIIKSMDAPPPVLPGDARPVDLGSDGEPVKADEDAWPLDLLPLNLQPKDRLNVYIEAVDNDTVTGPKVAVSEPVLLKVSSAEDKHLEIIEEQEKIVEALLDTLGDYLEFPVGEREKAADGQWVEGVPAAWTATEFSEHHDQARPANDKAADVVNRMRALLERMGQDPLMITRDLELFKMTHDELYDRNRDEAEQFARMALHARTTSIPRPQMERLFGLRKLSVRAAEKGVIRLEDLIASERMDNLLDTAKSLKEARERLKELLEKYKATGDEALKAEIMREIQRLKQRMMELMAKMREQVKNLPKEHVNLEALEREGMVSDINDLNSNLDKIQQQMEDGDIEGALAALDEMGESIDDMLGQMEEDFAAMQPDGVSELDKNVAKLMDDLNNLQAQEEQIAEQTEKIADDIDKRDKERLDKLLDAFVKDELDKVKAIKERLDGLDANALQPQDREDADRLRANADQLQKALENKDIATALEQAEQLQTSLEQAREDLRQRGAMVPRNSPAAEPYARAAETVRKTTPDAKEVANDLRDLLDRAQGGPTPEEANKMENLSREQGKVQLRAGEMQQKLGEMGKEFPMLQEQLGPGLGEAKQLMEGAGQRLKEGQGRKAHTSERMALDKLGQLKEQLKQTMKQQNKPGDQQNGRDVNRDKVEIPDANRDAPRAFREDLMDAMKEGSLESYDSELKQYYESLVK